jgi:dTDP-4-amino-4,6-dideoxygalactose transaminase
MDAVPGAVEVLRRLTGREHVLLTGRGATALYLVLRAAGLRNARIALPGNLCPAAVCPVLYSGNVPVFLDVNLVDFGPDLRSVQQALEQGAKAVIVAHSYGHAAPMAEISRLCREAGALLIEDAAPALGTLPDGAPAGSHGDCSILSFGYAKIIDAGGGGALVTDDPGLFREAERLERELPAWSEALDRRAADMAHVVRGWWNARRSEPRLDALLQPLWGFYADVHLHRGRREAAGSIAAALRRLPEVVESRQANFEAYQVALAGTPFLRPEPRPGSVCWRYTFLANNVPRDTLVERLRAKGLDVSTLYPAAHHEFATPDDRKLPNCDRLDQEVVNLWVAPPLTPADIRRNAGEVLGALDSLSHGVGPAARPS